jgi:copper chaperone CopZ
MFFNYPMKTLVTPLMIAIALFSLGNPIYADGGGAHIVKSVLSLDPEIDCPSCEDYIKHTLVTAHGVQSADVDVLNNRITIRYDANSINLKALIGRIRVYGYTASEVK